MPFEITTPADLVPIRADLAAMALKVERNRTIAELEVDDTDKMVEQLAAELKALTDRVTTETDAGADRLDLLEKKVDDMAKVMVRLNSFDDVVIPPTDPEGPATGDLPYTRLFDSAENLTEWGSAGGPNVDGEVASIGGRTCLKWNITQTSYFGKFHSPFLTVPTSGIVDVDFGIYFPQGWFDAGQLPLWTGKLAEDEPPEGDYMTWKAMKLFRMFPPGQSGHNATLFGELAFGRVYLRDFDNDKPSNSKVITRVEVSPDTWYDFRIRTNYTAGTTGLWLKNGETYEEVGTVVGGCEEMGYVGPIMHATSRNETRGYGEHDPFYVAYSDYTVTHTPA